MKELSEPFIEHQSMHKQNPKIKWISAQLLTTNQNYTMQNSVLGLNTRQRDKVQTVMPLLYLTFCHLHFSTHLNDPKK